MNRTQRLFAAALVAALAISTGCAQRATQGPAPASPPAAQGPVDGLAAPDSPGDPATQAPPVTQAPADKPPEPAAPSWVAPVTDENFQSVVEKYHPNELGRVLILEYHHLGDEEDRWTRQRENFRNDLQMLYNKGYRAVSLLDYLNDRMPLPAGTSPVIFTFDDSLESQMTLKDGTASPESAVGIMLEFKREHPDFGAAGTFYVNFTPVPFREPDNWEEKVKFMAANDFEIANHSLEHDDLSLLSDEDVQKSLGSQVEQLRKVLPDYDGSTLALPFGNWPENQELAVEGEWNGLKYRHRAVLLVGADPVYSPYDKRLDVMALPRVQAIDSEFERWMPYLDNARYISDGDPATVVVPEDMMDVMGEKAAAGKKVRTYHRESQ